MLFLFDFEHGNQRAEAVTAIGNGFRQVLDLHSYKLLLLGYLAAQFVQGIIGPLPAAGLGNQSVHYRMMLGDILDLVQESVMQSVRIDPIDRALRFPLLTVKAAVVSHLASFGGPGRVGAAAVGTMHQPAQEIVIAVLTGWGHWLAAFDAFLHTLPGLTVHQRFVTGFVAPVAKLLHSQIDFTSQKQLGGSRCPIAGRDRAQVIPHGSNGAAIHIDTERMTGNVGILRVRHKAFRRLLALAVEPGGIRSNLLLVAEGRHSPSEIACFDHCFHFSFCPAAYLFNIHPIHELCHLLVDMAAHIVGEELFNHLHFDAGFFEQVLRNGEGIAASQATHVGTDNGVEAACFGVSEKPLEVRAFESGSADPFVFVGTDERAAFFPNVLCVEFLLHIGCRKVIVLLIIAAAPGVGCITDRASLGCCSSHQFPSLSF